MTWCVPNRVVGWVFVGLACHATLSSIPARADHPWPIPVHRMSNDRQADLIKSLIERGMLDQATEICAIELANADALSDTAAQWSIRWSQVEAQKQLLTDDFTDQRIELSNAPLAELLARYPDHPRRLFLQAAMLETRWSAARHDVVVGAVRPAGNEATERALDRITRLSSDVNRLIEEILAARSREATRPAGARDRDERQRQEAVSDLVRLQQELHVLSVSMALLQTELFAPESRDHVAAATAAIAAADAALPQLPADCQARYEVERIRVQAILRSGDLRRARAELQTLKKSSGADHSQHAPWLILALEIKLDLAGGQYDAARLRLEAFYDPSPLDAPRSIELDLVRLEFLILTQDRELGQWLDAIQTRSGLYARRRAEAISLSRVSSSDQRSLVDPALIAAQGQDWLRRGNPQRAAELLSAAAGTETNHDHAMRYAGEAAAALVANQMPYEAGELLAELSLVKSAASSAPAWHLQAAFLFASSGRPEIAEKIELALRQTIQRWPASEAAGNAKSWLVKLLTQQQRLIEAAEATMPIPNTLSAANPASPSELEPNLHQEVWQAWSQAIRAAEAMAETAVRDEVEQRLVHSFMPWWEDQRWRSSFLQAAVLLLDRSTLIDLTKSHTQVLAIEPSDDDEAFLVALLNYRLDKEALPSLPPVPDRITADVRWRLMQDGLDDPERQASIARLINHWETESTDSMERALRMAWLGEVAEGVKMFRRLIAASPTPGQQLRLAAQWLARSASPEGQVAAVAFWDELAIGLPKGSTAWHEAKLSAIALLKELQRSEEAARRAKYILLTSSPEAPTLKQQYQSYAEE